MEDDPGGVVSMESVWWSPNTEPELYGSNSGRSEAPSPLDGDASIRRGSRDGAVLEAEWITGTNGPKGMDSWRGRLHPADIDHVGATDLQLCKVLDKIPIDGAVGVNDLSVGDTDTLHISDHLKGCARVV